PKPRSVAMASFAQNFATPARDPPGDRGESHEVPLLRCVARHLPLLAPDGRTEGGLVRAVILRNARDQLSQVELRPCDLPDQELSRADGDLHVVPDRERSELEYLL